MSYTPPYHHTDEELLDADIADLEVDHRCALRDGLNDYAVEVAKQLAEAKDRRARIEKPDKSPSEAPLGK